MLATVFERAKETATPVYGLPPDLPLPIYRPVPGRHMVELVEPFRFQHYVLPQGYRWDGQSCPTWVWWLVGSPFEPASMAASLIHDELYVRGYYFDEQGRGHPISRLRSDAVFYDLCILYGVPKWKAWLKYVGLRVGGWLPWNRNRRKDAAAVAGKQ